MSVTSCIYVLTSEIEKASENVFIQGLIVIKAYQLQSFSKQN